MARTGRPETPIRYRLLAKIDFDATPGCWEWSGAKVQQGYGLIKRKDGAQLRAHRVAYELAYGEIPAGMFVCHRCDNPRCIRPSHLFLGNHDENMADMVIKIGPHECVAKSMAAPNWERMKWFSFDPSSTATLASHNDLAFHLQLSA